MSLSKDEHKTNESTGEVGEGKHHTGMSLPGWVGKRGRGHTHTHAPPRLRVVRIGVRVSGEDTPKLMKS